MLPGFMGWYLVPIVVRKNLKRQLTRMATVRGIVNIIHKART